MFPFKVECPSPWMAFEGSCYRLFTDQENWNNADSSCKANGALLVKIESAEEDDFISREFLVGEGKSCIGLTDAETEDDWKWSDGSQLTGYTNWMTEQPDNLHNNQHCAEIVKNSDFYSENYDGEWDDQECSKAKRYICE